MTDKTATDELRRLLDERGVEWNDGTFADGVPVTWRTFWRDRYIAKETKDGNLIFYGLTPKQAVEATLDMSQSIVRCCDCEYFDTRKCKSQWPFRLDGFCAWGKPREDA